MKRRMSIKALTLFLSLAVFGCSAEGNVGENNSIEGAAALANSVSSDAPVKLYSASSYTQSYHAIHQYASVSILVKNLAFDKKVYVHLREADGSWSDIAAAFVQPASNGYELWQAQINNSPLNNGKQAIDLTFALKYTVAGNTYWDNNNGKDYFVPMSEGPYYNEGLNVKSQGYSHDTLVKPSKVTFKVAVRNIAYAKTVNIVYTTDNWATSTTVPASFLPLLKFDGIGYTPVASPNKNNLEFWAADASITMNENGPTPVLFFIEYKVGGAAYYDNNFGQNYRL